MIPAAVSLLIDFPADFFDTPIPAANSSEDKAPGFDNKKITVLVSDFFNSGFDNNS